MPPLRNRVSITLTDSEFRDVNEVANLLGTKPSKIVYECVNQALRKVLEDGENRRRTLESIKALRSQVDWTDPDEPSGFLRKR